MRKTMSKKSVIASFVAIMASVVLLFGATQISSAKAQDEVTPVATWTLKAADGSGYNDSGQTNRKVKEICGAALTVSDMMFWDSATNAIGNGAPSGYPIYSVSTNHVGASPTITFTNQGISLKNADGSWKGIVVRVYAHLTTDKSAYYTENGGIRLYGADDDGTNNSGYMIPANIPQDQWVYLEIPGEYLADQNGDFSGFAVGSNVVGGASGEEGKKMYAGGSWSAEGSYVLFDTFSVNFYVVTFRDGDDVTQQIVEKNGKAEQPSTIPTKEGYTLLGWYDESGKKVDLTAGVKKSCTLTAKWQPANGTLKAADGSGYNDPGQTNRKVKEICGAVLTVSDMMFWDSATNAIGKGAPSGYPICSVSTNRVGASPTITFTNQGISLKNADGSWKGIVVRVYAHLTTDKSAYYTENGGIRLYGADDDGTNNSGYMIPANIPQDQWVYLEIPGEYLADQNGDFSGFAVGSNVVGGASGEEGKKMYAGGSWSAEGSYVLFDTFSVNFYVVTFRDGDDVTQQIVEKNGKAEQPSTIPTKEGYTFQGWRTEDGTPYAFDSPVTKSVTLVPDWAHIDGVLTAAESGDYTLKTSTLSMVAGLQDIGEGSFIPDGPLYVATYSATEIAHAKNKAINEALATSDDGSAFVYKTHSWGIQRAQNAIGFGATKKVSDVDALIIRIYTHLSSGKTYNTAFGGVTLYPLGADGSEGGYTIPADIVQDRWIDLVLTGNDLNALSQNGVLNGFQIGSGFRASEDGMAYQGTPGQENGAWILIDSVAAVRKFTVTYFDSDGESVLHSEDVYQGKTVESLFIPEKDGKVFTGWKVGGDYYNFDETVRSDLDLTAEWRNAVDIADASYNGYYEKDGEFITILDGETEFSNGLVPKSAQIADVQLSDENELFVITKSGVFSFRLGADGFVKQSYCVITFDFGFGEPIRQVVRQGGVGRPLPDGSTERNGYIFNGWKGEDGTAFFFGETAVSADVTVYADWNYNCIADNGYAWYYGTYYNRGNGKTIVLKEGNDAVYDNKEYKYYILVSDELVIELNGKEETFNATMYSSKIAVGGENYYRLKNYQVVFDTDGGSETESVIVGEEQGWKLTPPAAPTKEGYIFKGWYLADGTAYDFDSVVSGGFTLFAQWESANGTGTGDETKKGCGSTISSSAALVGMLALVGIF